MRCKWIFSIIIALIPILLLSSCTSTMTDGPPNYPVDVSKIHNATPRYEPKSRYGNPTSYEVLGRRYYILTSSKDYDERGIASWYGRKFNGHLTSSREPYNMLAMTGASRVLPIPTFVRVTNLENGRWVIVKINDRGPFAPNRIIDLSYAAAKKLGYAKKGTALVEVAAIDTANPNQLSIYPLKNPRLYLQLGAFAQFSHAERLADELKHYTHKPVMIKESPYHHSTIYRVLVGPLRGVGESDRLHHWLKSKGFVKAFTVIG